MDFNLSEERAMLRDSLRGTLERSKSADTLWSELADLGLFAALFGEAEGGFGGEGADLAVVFTELGRAGCALPVLDHAILAGGLLAASGNEALATVMDGSVRFALAHEEEGSGGELLSAQTRATRAGSDGYKLDGRKIVVVGGAEADRLVISARLDGGDELALFLLPGDAPGMERHPAPLLGGGEAADVVLSGVELPADAVLCQGETAADALRAMDARAILCLCAEMLGLMERAQALTVDYVGTRKQFGKPIGSFQALQHRIADMAMEVEQARSAVANLADALGTEDEARQASAAKHLVGRTARLVAEESIQIHGGIGMTAEYELGHFVRRLIEAEARFGNSDHHLARFVELSRPLWEARAA